MEDVFISNMTFRVVLLGIQEIIGENGLSSLLNYTGLKHYIDNFPPNNHEKNRCKSSEITRLDQGIADIFGEKGANAILFQVGKKQAKWGLEENTDVVDATKKVLKDLDENNRVKTALEIMAATVAAELNSDIWVEEHSEYFLYKTNQTTHCFNRKSSIPVCYVSDGFITGILEWATDTTYWASKEEKCMAMGEPHCTFRIKKAMLSSI